MKDVVRRNFDASVSAYEAYERRTGRFAALSRLLAAELSARSDSLDLVLDAGAGSGASTAVLGETADRVVALDSSRAMLLANESGDRVQGDIDRLPLAKNSVDAVAFTASLFLVPDPTVAVAEARRVLRPGGVVGAVAPLGWVDQEGADPFAHLDRESRSPVTTDDVMAALDAAFTTETGSWSFPTTAATIETFHRIPAMAARLYPRADPEERVRRATELVGAFEGTFEERWQWIVGN